ncbi:rap guanine nucleotide exchange factor 6-like isoform X2 [Corticium candelabrum]|uniref:rap guanine nucleotide exchange factor 6-like isoform X2 n=1 Tax=Corticium candelabrum TaxID=121492 RepID=UPI002E260E39|nr:rap guanine nucleotide exchange factor 6-like isoform X2 [Corticium candelabrum]
MSEETTSTFLSALKTSPGRRTDSDIAIIADGLRHFPAFEGTNHHLRDVAATARYERHVAESVLYYRGDLATSWFLLLSGSVLAGADLFVSGTSFGNDVDFGRPRDETAIVLEPSQFIVCCCGLGEVKSPDIEIIDEDYLRKLIAPPPPKTLSDVSLFVGDDRHPGAIGHTRESSMSSGYSSPSALSLDSSVSKVSTNHSNGAILAPRQSNSCNEFQHARPESLGLSSRSSSSESLSSASSSILTAPRSPGLFRAASVNPNRKRHLSSPLSRRKSALDSTFLQWKPVTVNNLDLIGAEMQHFMDKTFSGLGGHGNLCRHESVLMTPISNSKTKCEQKGNKVRDCQQELSQNFDLDDLPESSVDSDEDDIFMNDPNDCGETVPETHDPVLEALMKSPVDRGERDIALIHDFVQNLPAFASVSLGVRKALCSKVQMKLFDREMRVVRDGRELSSWYVVFDGQLELMREGQLPSTLYAGDTFGITAHLPTVIHEGTLVAKTPCQVLEVDGEEYLKILKSQQENVQVVTEGDQRVLVSEKRKVGEIDGFAVIQGTADKLLQQLLEFNSVDPTYVEDFLLTYRTFISDPKKITEQLLKWLDSESKDEKLAAVNVMSVWVGKHFADFDGNEAMMGQLNRFRTQLKDAEMMPELHNLDRASSGCSKKRVVTLTRDAVDMEWGMDMIIGNERQSGAVFVSDVKEKSLAATGGISVGDQVISLNDHNVEQLQLSRVKALCNDGKKMVLILHYNIIGLKFALNPQDRAEIDGSNVVESMVTSPQAQPTKHSCNNISISKSRGSGHHKSFAKRLYGALSWRVGSGKSRPTLTPTTFTPVSDAKEETPSAHDNSPSDSDSSSPKLGGYRASGEFGMVHSTSMPVVYQDTKRELSPLPQISSNVDHVIKIYRADGGHRYIPVSNHTTASQVVALAVAEFELSEGSSTFSLCQITTNQERLVTQKKLPDFLDKLSERLGVYSRYYLKPHDETGTLVHEDVAEEILKEGCLNIQRLDIKELVRELTMRDFETFQTIDAAEFIVDLWGCQSNVQADHLKEFADLVNQEMFWVVTEICRTRSSHNRVKVLKAFIKAARYCQDARNYNTMFAILSGLGHRAIERLKGTWDKVPSKYIRAYHEMQRLMDPTRNMSRYRAVVYGAAACPPLLPFFPVIKKDLMFMYLGNDSVVDSLINFEKLRMLSGEIRNIKKMAAIPYDPQNVFLEFLNVSNQQLFIKSSTGTMKRRSGASGHTSLLKRIYEQRVMERRVSEYLDNLPVLDDENVLDNLSEACEPSMPSAPVRLHRSSLAVPAGGSTVHPRTMSLSSVVVSPRIKDKNISPKEHHRRNSLKDIQEGVVDGHKKMSTSSAMKRLSGSISPFHIRRKKGVHMNGHSSSPVTATRLEVTEKEVT